MITKVLKPLYYNRISTGCRGIPQQHHVLTQDYYDPVKRESFVFNSNISQICILLFDGPLRDKYHSASIEKSEIWERYFKKRLYLNQITWYYRDQVDLPRGVIFNHKLNEIITLDNHISIDNYFRKHCLKSTSS